MARLTPVGLGFAMTRNALAVVLAGGLLFAPAALAADPCPIERFPDISVTFIRDHPAVPVGINGTYVFFLLDTGFTRTSITPTTQARFKLPVDARFRSKGLGVGGVVTSPYAVVKRFEFSGQTYIDPPFPVVGLDRTTRPNEPPDLFAGVIGGDFLRNYDVELDFGHDAMRLFRRPPCAPAHPIWGASYQTIPIRVTAANVVILPVAINGNRLRALLDTGATRIVLRLSALSGAGIDAASLRGDPTTTALGAGGLTTKAWTHKVGDIEIGGDHLVNPTVMIEDFKFSDAEMLIGTPYTRARKIWLAYSANLMFIEIPEAR
jgi:predicted aspartyl protease